MTTAAPPALRDNVQAVLRRAQAMVLDGKNSAEEVAGLIGDIGRLPDDDRRQLFDAFETVKKEAGAPRSREAVEVVLGALREQPALALARLEQADGVVDMKDALTALASITAGTSSTGPGARVSVFTAMLFAKATPEARDTLLEFASEGRVDIDHTMRALLQRGHVTADEIHALKAAVGDDAYGCYQLSYWAQTTKPEDFAPGGETALHAAAEETYGHVARHYREDLELNRGRPCTPKGARALDLFSRETLQLPYRVSFTPGSYLLEVDGQTRTFGKPDDLAAFLIDTALKKAGHDIDAVTWDPQNRGSYVVTKGAARQSFTYHSELLRQFGYAL